MSDLIGWQTWLSEEERRYIGVVRQNCKRGPHANPVFPVAMVERFARSLAASRALVVEKNKGLLWYSMPTHEGCLGADCPCMPGRALALTEAEMRKRLEA